MQRPTILNRLITLRARRISPTRPARLVGPSRLLRRDEVRSPHTNRPRDQSPECGVLVAIAAAITQSATSNPFLPPNGLLDRVEYLSGALVMMTTASSNQTSLPAFTSQTSHAVLWRR